jgi:cytochrome oxidase Cu insertion factor (SCO1/SenC/PrrC family)
VRSNLAAALAAVLVSTVCACTSNGSVPAPAKTVGQQTDVALSRAILDAGLDDSSGRKLTIASLRGKIVVVSDMMTLCQGTCPLDTANIAAAARRVRAAGLSDRVVFLSVTIDPARDTRARLAAYRRLYAPAPPNWLTLTGSAQAITQFWNRFGVYRKTVPETEDGRDWITGKPLHYDITHSDQVFFLDAQGHQRFELDGPPHVTPGTPIPPALLSFLSAEGRRDLAHPDAAAWTVQQELQVLGWLLDRNL